MEHGFRELVYSSSGAEGKQQSTTVPGSRLPGFVYKPFSNLSFWIQTEEKYEIILASVGTEELEKVQVNVGTQSGLRLL